MAADGVLILPAVEFGVRPLESRLRPPRPCLALVVRRTLLDALGASSAPLTLVSAPAGAGKTALLMQYFDEVAGPKAWLTLDDDANDPVVLLTYVALALTRVAEVEPDVLEWLRLPGPPSARPSCRRSARRSPPRRRSCSSSTTDTASLARTAGGSSRCSSRRCRGARAS